jgi:hypothetical protein
MAQGEIVWTRAPFDKWNELALGLVVNRTVPFYLLDRVEAEVDRVFATYGLPWQL